MSETDPLVGQRISNYEITRKLGQGGMGVVYQARHLTLETDVAIKFLAVQLATDPSYIERFLREARAAARLHHGNLITVHDAGVDGDVYYMVMEYVEGDDLLKMMRQQRVFTEEEVIYIGVKTAEALAYAHQQGLVHRDIKPENLILTVNGEVKVADLGLAKQLQDENASMTMSGMVVGTPYYISPEQVRGLKEIDARTDVYSLGVTLFHLATTQVPFKGNSSAEIMSKHLTETAPDARSLNPQLTPALSGVLAKMMAKEPPERLQTMEEVALALDGVLHGRAAEGVSEEVSAAASGGAVEAPKRVLRVPTLPPDGDAGRLRVPASALKLPTDVPDTPSPPPQPSTPTPAPVVPEFQKLKLKAEPPPVVHARPPSKLPVGRIAVVVLAAVLGCAAFYFYPRMRGSVEEAKTKISTQVAAARKPRLPPLDGVILQNIERSLSDAAARAAAGDAGSVSFDMTVDGLGAITALKLSPGGTATASLAAMVEKGIRGSAPFTREGAEASSPGWQGTVNAAARVVQSTVQRPLTDEEKNLVKNDTQALTQISQQIAALEAEAARKPADPKSEPAGNAGGGLKGDFRGGLSDRFAKNDDSGRVAEQEQRRKEIAERIAGLKQREQRIRDEMAPYQAGKLPEQVKRYEFSVEVAGSAPTPTPTTP